MAEVKAAQKKKFQVPHILILIFIIAMVACLASYVAPVGVFDLDDKGNAIAGTYHAVERSAVSPIQAMLWVKRGIENASSIISLMLIGGGSIACVVASDGKLTMERRFQLIRNSDQATLLRGRWDLVCIELGSGKPRRMPEEFCRIYLPALTAQPGG